ncbi:hypothetical protein ACFJIX_00920 [Roseateles sp. UC29_93]|uniref:hypothetical protein n=1 Tax=Roseateles sp. UC29_93 TaxID=3350177 RepID=UPI0036718A69
MDNFIIQFFLNSGPVPYLTVRHSELFASKRGRFSLIGFLFAVFGINALLNLDRYTPPEAFARAGAFAIVIALCIGGLAFFRHHRRAKAIKTRSCKGPRATAADTPSTPPDRAP